jgi:hypothetical protein
MIFFAYVSEYFPELKITNAHKMIFDHMNEIYKQHKNVREGTNIEIRIPARRFIITVGGRMAGRSICTRWLEGKYQQGEKDGMQKL